jgi:uncharacterized membrane protein YphA (DoxX/SURF4 family)
MTHPWLTLAMRLILGAVFIYAGGVKLFDLPAMADAIGNYRILPTEWLNLFGILLPPLEVLIGVGLILGVWMEGALTLVTGLIVVFLIAVESAILRGLDIDCGCFGTSDGDRVGIVTLLRDFLLLLATIPLWMERYYAFHPQPAESASEPESPLAERSS